MIESYLIAADRPLQEFVDHIIKVHELRVAQGHEIHASLAAVEGDTGWLLAPATPYSPSDGLPLPPGGLMHGAVTQRDPSYNKWSSSINPKEPKPGKEHDLKIWKGLRTLEGIIESATELNIRRLADDKEVQASHVVGLIQAAAAVATGLLGERSLNQLRAYTINQSRLEEPEDPELNKITRLLSEQEQHIVRFLWQHPSGVTIEKFCAYEIPGKDGKHLTTSENRSSIESMLRRLSSQKLKKTGWAISTALNEYKQKIITLQRRSSGRK